MNPLDDLLDSEGGPVDNGVALMTELVAAVAWLRRDAMPGLTIWDAIEQALRWRSGTEADWRAPDPLRAALKVASIEQGVPLERQLAEAIRLWLAATSHLAARSHHVGPPSTTGSTGSCIDASAVIEHPRHVVS